MSAEFVSATGALFSGVAACAALFVTWRVHINQKELVLKVSDSQNKTDLKIHNSQQLLAQRQILVPLWEHMANLRSINHSNPCLPDVIKIVNTLELVAICCEGGMIDEKIIRRTFKDQFLKHYRGVLACTNLGPLGNGAELLAENNAARSFFQKLDSEKMGEESVSAI